MGKVYENGTKIKKKCYFMKLTSKRVISISNLLFDPKIRLLQNFDKRNWRVWFWAKFTKTARKLRKSVIL